MESRILIRRTHGEFVAVGLAQHDGARRLQPSHRRRVIRRDEVVEDFRARSRAHALGAQHVLDRHGHAGQRRQRVTLVGHGIDTLRLAQRTLLAERQICANCRVFSFNFLIVSIHQRGRRGLLFQHRRPRRIHRQYVEIGHFGPLLLNHLRNFEKRPVGLGSVPHGFVMR
jgi:hypothetical protein